MVRQSISTRLDEDTLNEIERIRKQRKCTRSDVVRDAIAFMKAWKLLNSNEDETLMNLLKHAEIFKKELDKIFGSGDLE